MKVSKMRGRIIKFHAHIISYKKLFLFVIYLYSIKFISASIIK